jgi:hypothetical protein
MLVVMVPESAEFQYRRSGRGRALGWEGGISNTYKETRGMSWDEQLMGISLEWEEGEERRADN